MAVVGSHAAEAQSKSSGLWGTFGVGAGTARGSCGCISGGGSPGPNVIWPGLALGTRTTFSGSAKAGFVVSGAIRVGAQLRASVSSHSGTIADVVDLGPTVSFSFLETSARRMILTVTPGVSCYRGGWNGGTFITPGGIFPSGDVSISGVGSTMSVELGYEFPIPRSRLGIEPQATYVYDDVASVAHGWRQSLVELGTGVTFH
jgi:hypothetical protein